MISIELSPDIERQFHRVVHDSYKGSLQQAVVTLLRLHQRYDWKEQLQQDVNAVRAEVQRQGGITPEDIDDTIKEYRKIEKQKAAVSSDVSTAFYIASRN